MAQYLNDFELSMDPFAGINRGPFGFEGWEPPPEQPFNWGGLWDSVSQVPDVSGFDPMQHWMEMLFGGVNYMQPSNQTARTEDAVDLFLGGDSDRARMIEQGEDYMTPEYDQIDEAFFGGLGEAGAAGLMKLGPKVGNEALKMMTFGEISGRDVLGHTPQFINSLNRRLGLPEMPFEMPATGYHYGRTKGLTELDPSYHGQGAMGKERQYSQYMDEDLKPTYFYLTDEKGVRPEAEVLSGAKSVYKADLPDDLMYDRIKDPEGLWKAALDETAVMSGTGNAMPSEAVPIFSRKLKNSGYKGYFAPNPQSDQPVGVVFGKTAVEEMPEGFGMSRQGIYPDPDEGHNVLVGENTIKMVQPKRAESAGEEVVWLDMNKLDESWKQDKGFYLPFSGGNRIGTRYEDLQRKLPTLEDLDMPEVGFNDMGNIAFTDGRHRAALLRDKGVTRIPVSMTKGDAALAREMGFEAPRDTWYRGTSDPDEVFRNRARGAGHWTRERAVAEEYGDSLMQAGISVRNPKVISDEEWRMIGSDPKEVNRYRRQGYDALISDDTGDIIPLQPEQIFKHDPDIVGDIPPPPQVAVRGTGTSAGVGKSRGRVGTTGQYVGAPAGVNTPQALGRLRKNYGDTAKLGAGGRDWYHDSSVWLSGVTPNNIRGKQMADLLGVTSQGTNVDTNLGFAVKGTVQDAVGQPIHTGRFAGPSNDALNTAILRGQNPDLGPKRTPFAENLTVDWNPFLNDRPVHDIWQGRAMGYKTKTGAPWNAGFSPQQHAFMDEQMDIINMRLSEEGAMGFDDWDNLRTQAAAWTGEKIKAGEITPDMAAMHYGSYSPKYQANATHEAVTGRGAGHLEGMVDMPHEVRQKYSDQSLWIDDKGRDTLYSDVGLFVEPTDSAQGVFKTKSGEIEFNPAQVGHPLVGMAGPTGARHVSPESRAILDAVEGTRAYVGVQNAGAWHKLISGNKAGESSSLRIPMERKVTQDEMRSLAKIAEDNGMFAVDTGRGVNLINDPFSKIGKKRTGKSLGTEIKGELGDTLKLTLPEGKGAQRVTADTGYIDYEYDPETGFLGWQKGEGTGEVTAKLKSLFDNQPELLNRLDQSEALRSQAVKKLELDEKFAKQNNMPVREDIQTARRIIAESGLKGLFRALEQGVVLPAVVLGLVPLLTEQPDGST